MILSFPHWEIQGFLVFSVRGPGVFHLRYGTLRRLRPGLGPGPALALAPADPLLHRSRRFGAGSNAHSAVGHWNSSGSHERRSLVSMLGEGMRLIHWLKPKMGLV